MVQPVKNRKWVASSSPAAVLELAPQEGGQDRVVLDVWDGCDRHAARCEESPAAVRRTASGLTKCSRYIAERDAVDAAGFERRVAIRHVEVEHAI